MFKLVLACFIILSFASCGVDTNSSSSQYQAPTDPDDENSTDPTDPDDGNSTDPTDPTYPTDPTDCEDSIFDCTDAELDLSACDSNKYRFASDASYAGSQDGENGSSLYSITGEGLWIGSEHLEADAQDRDKTWVTLFYKSFPDKTSLNLQGSTSYKMDGIFILSYDIAWSDESISGIDNTMYVQSSNYEVDNGEKPSCYRAVINSVTGSQIDVTKVYR